MWLVRFMKCARGGGGGVNRGDVTEVSDRGSQ